MCKVSVVMPAYNAEKYIAEAIESILNQTYTDFEFIIVNDGSKDKTKDIILSYDDSRIVYLENEVNQGIVVTLNKGIELAKGKYIARFDSDDIAYSTRLEKQVRYMDNHEEVCVLGTGITIFGENVETKKRNFATNPEKLKAELLLSSCVAHPTVIMRKDTLEKNNFRYDDCFAGAEDYHLWWRMAEVAKISTLGEPLHYYRIHENQITQQYTEKDRKILEDILVMKMNVLDVELNEEEKNVFLDYCCGNYKSFSEEKIKRFADILAIIIRKNSKKAYFKQKFLKEVCGLAVTYVIDNANLDKEEGRKCYNYAVSKKIYPLIMRIKLLYHRKFI